MSARKDTPPGAQHDALTALEIERTVQIATQACNGLELSDEELDTLCDAVISSRSFAFFPATKANAAGVSLNA